MDRTPLQRMLVASLLHSQLTPEGRYVPPSMKDSAACDSDPLGLRTDSWAPLIMPQRLDLWHVMLPPSGMPTPSFKP